MPVKVSDEGSNMLRTCEAGGKRHILTPEKEYPDFFKSYFAEPKEIPFDENEILANYKNHRSNAWSYADWDGDGDLDLVIGIGIWDDYGWDNAYDSLGNWKNGPLHGASHGSIMLGREKSLCSQKAGYCKTVKGKSRRTLK